MITKAAFATVVTACLALGGSLARASDDADEKVTLVFNIADASSAEERARVLERLKRTARDECHDTGTRLRDKECEAHFIDAALDSISNKSLQAQLKQDHLGTAAQGVAVAEAPGG